MNLIAESWELGCARVTSHECAEAFLDTEVEDTWMDDVDDVRRDTPLPVQEYEWAAGVVVDECVGAVGVRNYTKKEHWVSCVGEGAVDMTRQMYSGEYNEDAESWEPGPAQVVTEKECQNGFDSELKVEDIKYDVTPQRDCDYKPYWEMRMATIQCVPAYGPGYVDLRILGTAPIGRALTYTPPQSSTQPMNLNDIDEQPESLEYEDFYDVLECVLWRRLISMARKWLRGIPSQRSGARGVG